MHAKYIVINSKGTDLLFTFPADVVHSSMLDAIHNMMKDHVDHWSMPYADAHIVSAGFVNNGNCYGRSESLDVESRPLIDTALLQRGGM